MRRLPRWKPRFLLVPLRNSLSPTPAVSSMGHGRVPPFHHIKDAAKNTGSGFILGISQNLFNSTEETFNSAETHMTELLAITYSCKTISPPPVRPDRTDPSFSASIPRQPQPRTAPVFPSCPIISQAEGAQHNRSVDSLSLQR